jgi:tetraacyldisaccharide 4'-kinase
MADILNSLFFFGRPLSPFYSLCMRLRSNMYSNGFFRREKMGVPVISVGNLTMGGTGKTPIVRYIAEFLSKNGFRPAVISRGYGGRTRDKINVVSDGKTVLMDAVKAGDEPVLLAESLPGIPIVTGAVRSYPCRFAVENLGCDILILDDGFQHLPIVRDVDLVLFNASSPLGNNRVFPGGELREPFSALSRANAFMVTGMTEELQGRIQQLRLHLRKNFPQSPFFTAAYDPFEVRKINSSQSVSLSDLPLNIYGFCGIAKPWRFHTTLKRCGFRVKGLTELRDHQVYNQELIDRISRLAEAAGAQALITTEKDMVKIRSLITPLPLYSLTMSVHIDDAFSDFLLNRLGKSDDLVKTPKVTRGSAIN